MTPRRLVGMRAGTLPDPIESAGEQLKRKLSRLRSVKIPKDRKFVTHHAGQPFVLDWILLRRCHLRSYLRLPAPPDISEDSSDHSTNHSTDARNER